MQRSSSIPSITGVSTLVFLPSAVLTTLALAVRAVVAATTAHAALFIPTQYELTKIKSFVVMANLSVQKLNQKWPKEIHLLPYLVLFEKL